MVAVTALTPAVWLVTLISTVPSGSVITVGAVVTPLSANTLTTGAQAAAQTLISACQHREPQNLFPLYHHNVERSLLWDVLQRYQHVPALLQRPGWYRAWPALMQDISRDLWDQGDKPVPPLRQLFWRHLRRHGLWHLAGDVIRSLRCL